MATIGYCQDFESDKQFLNAYPKPLLDVTLIFFVPLLFFVCLLTCDGRYDVAIGILIFWKVKENDILSLQFD